MPICSFAETEYTQGVEYGTHGKSHVRKNRPRKSRDACAGKAYPTSAVNRLLSEWKSKNVTSVEEAKRLLSAPSPSSHGTAKNFTERTYTDEQLQAVMTNIDNLGDIDV